MFPFTGPRNIDRKARAATEHIRGEFFKHPDSFSDTDNMNPFTKLRSLNPITTISVF